MKSPDITDSTPYRMGWVVQQCKTCQWEATNLAVEYQDCPSCGEPVFDGAILRFGGLIVESERGGYQFILKNRTTGECVQVDRADVLDTIAFMIKHFKYAD